jgi:TRAP-type C4-dicarboxylate transport system permease small subunit
MVNNLDYFIAFMIFLIIYGFYFKIWNKSRTTVIVINFTFLLSLLVRSGQITLVLPVVAFFMFLLFVRAVFRERIQNSKYKELFYA